jgi:hypothetical protein
MAADAHVAAAVYYLGFLFLGWLFAGWIRGPSPHSSLGWIAVLSSGAAQAVVAFLSVLAQHIDSRLRRSWPRLPRLLGPIALLVTALFLFNRAGKIEETVMVAIAMSIALPLSLQSSGSWRRASVIAFVALIVLVSGINRSIQTLEWRVINPIVTWADHRGDDADAARWASSNTTEGAVFLIPPDMGTFRLLARRAVVVDFESLPFEAVAMREWKKRIGDCYGVVTSGGFDAINQMEQNYRAIKNADLDQITVKYNPEFAVLFAGTDTSRSVIYGNSTYKIISLTD